MERQNDLVRKDLHVGVTGAGGYIGAALVDYLLQLGYRVKALDRFSSVPLPSWGNPVSVYDVDLTLPNDQLDAFVCDLDFVFDLAAIADVQQCEQEGPNCLLHNALARLRVLNALKTRGVTGYLLPSSVAAVYGNPDQLPVKENHPAQPVNLYGLSKLWAEQAVQMMHRSSPLKAVIVRQSNVYGPSPVFRPAGVIHQFLCRALRGQSLQIYGHGRQCRDFVFVQDLLQAYVRLMETVSWRQHGVVTVNIAGEVCSINELAHHCIEAVYQKTGVKVPLIHQNPRLESDAQELDIDTGLLAEILGEWKPVPLQQGIERTLEAIQKKCHQIGDLSV